MTVNEMFYERYPAAVLEHQIQVRPFNVEKTRNMRSLNPEGLLYMYSCYLVCVKQNGTAHLVR